VRSVPFIQKFLRMLECRQVRCCPLCIRSAVGFFGGGFAKTESAAPQKSDGSAIHPYLSFSMGAPEPRRMSSGFSREALLAPILQPRRRPTPNQVYSKILKNVGIL
jgi:hypothetical protein